MTDEEDTLTAAAWQVLKQMPKATPANDKRYRYRMNHDAWAWVLVAIAIGGFILLEVLR